jgi:DnaK suppressor protein
VSKEKALTQKQKEKIKEKLIEEKEKLFLQDAAIDENLNTKDEMADEVDMATVDLTQAQILRMRNRDLFYLKKIEKALISIESDDFGICEECGADIKFARLLARPTAELCINCKEDMERDEDSSISASKSKSLGEVFKAI